MRLKRIGVVPNGHVHWPEDPPSVARDHTVRRFDAATGELTIDAITDHDGPGSRWALEAADGCSMSAASSSTEDRWC